MKKELTLLTAVRGLAAIWIVLLHSNSLEGVDFSRYHWLGGLINNGWLGVDLFFILSGFVLSYSYADQVIDRTRFSVKSFYIKRFARVYPTHLFVLLLFVPIVSYSMISGSFSDPQHRFTVSKFCMQLFLLHGIGIFDGEGWNLPSWAVSSEFLAYLLYPGLALFLRRFNTRSKSIMAMIVVILLGISLSLVLGQKDSYHLPFEFTWFRVLSEFVLGILLYSFYTTFEEGRLHSLWVVLGLCGIGFQVFVKNSFYDFLYLVYFMMIIFGLSLVGRGRKVPILGKLGELSYSLYLIHALVIIVLNQMIRRIPVLSNNMSLCLLLLVSISLVSAWILYRFIENPMRSKIIKKMVPKV